MSRTNVLSCQPFFMWKRPLAAPSFHNPMHLPLDKIFKTRLRVAIRTGDVMPRGPIGAGRSSTVSTRRDGGPRRTTQDRPWLLTELRGAAGCCWLALIRNLTSTKMCPCKHRCDKPQVRSVPNRKPALETHTGHETRATLPASPVLVWADRFHPVAVSLNPKFSPSAQRGVFKNAAHLPRRSLARLR